MNLITSALALTSLLAGVAFCQTGCDSDCINKYTRCGTKNNWMAEDCGSDRVREKCALMCGTCVPCDKADGEYGPWEKVSRCSDDCLEGDVEISVRECNDPPPMNGGAYCEGSPIRVRKCEGCAQPASVDHLEEKCNECSARNSGSGFPQCPAHMKEGDYGGYKLALRHTGNEISAEQFLQLARTGKIDTLSSCPGSQYRDPDLDFYWSEVEEAILDIYDQNNERVAFIKFKLPLGPDHPSLEGMFNWRYVQDANGQHYSDIYGGSDIPMNFQDASTNYRNLYMAKSHGGCENDHVWFTVMNNNGVCDWDKTYGSEGKTSIVYSPYDIAAHALGSLAVASRFELRVTGDLDGDLGGYRKVLRYPNAAGVDFWGFYMDGITNSHHDAYPARNGAVRPDLFRSASFESDIRNAQKIKVVVYDMQGNVAESMTFRGADDILNWFSKDNLVYSSNWNLKDSDFNFFSILGDDFHGRRLFISTSYFTCPLDKGFMVVACMTPDEEKFVCDWEKFSGGVKENRVFLCHIYYTPTSGAVTWNDGSKMTASAIEIFTQ